MWITVNIISFIFIRVPEEERRRLKCTWRNYGWKIPKPKEGNRYPCTDRESLLRWTQTDPHQDIP